MNGALESGIRAAKEVLARRKLSRAGESVKETIGEAKK